MAFKMKGFSLHSGTAKHSSALKLKASALKQSDNDSIPNNNNDSIPDYELDYNEEEENDGDAVYDPEEETVPPGPITDEENALTEEEIKADAELPSNEEITKNEELIEETNKEEDAKEEVVTKLKPKKKKNIGKKGLYMSDKSWAEGKATSKEMGGDLDSWTKERREMKKNNPDYKTSNEYAKVQNKINEALGNKKRYPVTEDKSAESDKVKKLKEKQVVTDKKIVDKGENKMAKKGPKQTNEDGEKVYGAADEVTQKLNKSELKTTKKIQRQKVKDARKEFGRGSDEVKTAKATKKTEVKKTKQMVKTDKKDRKFVAKDEKYDRKITRRKDKGKSTTKLESKKAKNKQKEKEFGESLG